MFLLYFMCMGAFPVYLVPNGWKVPCECWKLNLGLLEVQPVLLITGSSLQSQTNDLGILFGSCIDLTFYFNIALPQGEPDDRQPTPKCGTPRRETERFINLSVHRNNTGEKVGMN